MPTIGQAMNRQPRSTAEQHYPATVTATGPPCTVALEPGGQTTTAAPLDGAAHPVGARVLVLVTSFGNYVIGRL